MSFGYIVGAAAILHVQEISWNKNGSAETIVFLMDVNLDMVRCNRNYKTERK